jgi:hypothetical protein
MTESDLVAIGPDIVLRGTVVEFGAAEWHLQFHEFVRGDLKRLIDLIDGFKVNPTGCYILLNALGDGRALAAAPTLTPTDDGFWLRIPVAARFPRMSADSLGSQWSIPAETNDPYLDAKRNIARVSGFESLSQVIRQTLSLQVGESPFFPQAGSRIGEYFEAYRGTHLLAPFIKLEVIRLAAIPAYQERQEPIHTPLRCIDSVRDVAIPSEALVNKRLTINLDLDVNGVGRWRCELAILAVFDKIPRNVG